VLYSLIETIYIVAFGTLREKKLLPTAIRAQFKAVKSFDIFEVHQSHLPEKDAIIKAKNALRNLRSNTRRGLML
jgi:hypothetical protein